MEFRIENQPVFTTLTINLQQGEQVKAEAGAMVSMSPTIDLKAKSTGKGIFGTIKAAVGGEALFGSLLTAESGPGEVVLAPAAVGDIKKFDLTGGTLYTQGGAWLAGSAEQELSTQGSFKALISGEGLFLQKITGHGPVFVSSYGAIIERTLGPGEEYIVDTGHIVAFEETVTYKVNKASKSIFGSLVSGEGLVCRYTGPGTIWLQTRNLSAFAKSLQPLMTKS